MSDVLCLNVAVEGRRIEVLARKDVVKIKIL